MEGPDVPPSPGTQGSGLGLGGPDVPPCPGTQGSGMGGPDVAPGSRLGLGGPDVLPCPGTQSSGLGGPDVVPSPGTQSSGMGGPDVPPCPGTQSSGLGLRGPDVAPGSRLGTGGPDVAPGPETQGPGCEVRMSLRVLGRRVPGWGWEVRMSLRVPGWGWEARMSLLVRERRVPGWEVRTSLRVLGRRVPGWGWEARMSLRVPGWGWEARMSLLVRERRVPGWGWEARMSLRVPGWGWEARTSLLVRGHRWPAECDQEEGASSRAWRTSLLIALGTLLALLCVFLVCRRYLVMQRLFPRIPHMKDPIGDTFQQDKLLGFVESPGEPAVDPQGCGPCGPAVCWHHQGPTFSLAESTRRFLPRNECAQGARRKLACPAVGTPCGGILTGEPTDTQRPLWGPQPTPLFTPERGLAWPSGAVGGGEERGPSCPFGSPQDSA
nr:interleukin-3 receptor subunit alpha isoform X4 [Macaca fascicularis]